MTGTEEKAHIIEEVIEEPGEIIPAQASSSTTGNWNPKTNIGKQVKAKVITDIDQILDTGKTILEAEIVDHLIPGLENDLLAVGQSKGKFGGGKRRVFRQTQKKTKEGNKPHFSTLCIVGNKDGYIGLGYGKSKETVPAREKATRDAKLHIFKIRRGCGSWECMCGEPHSIPFTVSGKCGSAKITLIPAPKGVGLCVEKECAKILAFAGIKDVWSKTSGQTRTTLNLIRACESALKDLIKTKIQPHHIERLSVNEGKLPLKDANNDVQEENTGTEMN
ncbi:MAG: 30S ribosomal protein S5 [archaeon]